MEITTVGAVVQQIVGKIGNTIYYRKGKLAHYARGTYKESGPSEKQKLGRSYYQQADMLWADLTEDEKDSWKAVTRGKGHTRYSTFMGINLRHEWKEEPMQRTP